MKTGTKLLSGLGVKSQEHYEHLIDGIYGTFCSPAGPVDYLQTKARLGSDNTTHGKLIKQLVPAREALNIDEMNFNELLQRDLDDHRIATKLIEYIINPPKNGLPGFFPPILAILLPFDEKQRPVESFPKPKSTLVHENRYGLDFQTLTHEGFYKSQVAFDKELNKPHEFSLGVIQWNSNRTKLVVIDGQHRAMALLAIERTLTNTWEQSNKGARYKPFYIDHINASLKAAGIKKDDFDFSKIELPVNICWFSNKDDSTQLTKCHLAARKLFVDVNNNAKPPSESRLVLLSDTQLDNIFTRDLLNRLRNEGNIKDTFPLYAVEYDNPDRNSTSPRRWSAVTSLEILKDAVVRTAFGPPKIFSDLKPTLQGRQPQNKMDERLREQLNLKDLFPAAFEDGDRRLKRDDIGNTSFPINDTKLHRKLLDKFFEVWGHGILYLLSHTAPFQAHIEALKDRYNSWAPGDNKSILAKDAIFEGVGMLWTIEDAHNLWKEQCIEAKQHAKVSPDRPDISKAWQIINEEQKPAFLERRSKIYLSSEKAEDLKDCDNLFKSLITYAAQVGLILTWATLHQRCVKVSQPATQKEIAQCLVTAINLNLTSGPNASRDRRKILLKESTDPKFRPLNMLPRLQPIYALYYRYLWLEIAMHDKGKEILGKVMDLTEAETLLNQGRTFYLNLLIDELKKTRIKDPDLQGLSQSDRSNKAYARAKKEIRDAQASAHKYWFGISKEDAYSLLDASLDKIPNISGEDLESDEDEDPDNYEDEVTPEQI